MFAPPRPLLLALLIVPQPTLQAQTFPVTVGETADGTRTTVPAPDRPFTVLGMAFSKKAQGDLEAWYGPAYLRFVRKHGLFAGAYDAAVYFLPVFTGLNKAAYEPSLKEFRKSATPEVTGHVVFCKGEWEPYRDALGLKDRDAPHFFVLARDGRVLHHTTGRFTEEKLDAMEEVLLGTR